MKKTITLIELVAVIIIVGIMTVGLGNFIIQIIDAWQFMDFRNEISQEGKKALDWMVRDIKEIKDSDSISVADTDDIQFTNSRDESIEYRLTGNTLDRNSYALCSYIKSLEFEYRDSSNNVLSPLPLPAGKRKTIRSIKITINLEKHNREIGFFSIIFPRSL